MSDNIYSYNDDDIFEDYVEQNSQPDDVSEINNSVQNNIDQVFSDIDSPFRNLLHSSSLKVNFGDAFYNAAYEWISQGYREANSVAIVNTLTEITDGKFLYNHRLLCSVEVLNRKKTIIRFLTTILEEESIKTVVKVNGNDPSFSFSETYFNMFFRSFYNIQLHSFYCELAVYKSMCEILELPIDDNLCDPFNSESLTILNATEQINDLYIKYFNHDDMKQKVDKHFDEIIQKKA